MSLWIYTAVPACLLVVCCLTGKMAGTRAGHLLGCGLFVLYAAEVFQVTGITTLHQPSFSPTIAVNLFRGFHANRTHFYLNAVMFLPLGFLLPFLWERFRRFPRTAVFGIALSVLIELAQMFCGRTTDIDDVLMNGLGTLVGYGLLALFALLFPQGSKACAMPDSGNTSPFAAVPPVLLCCLAWLCASLL